jgi:fatty acid amide hydrolase
VLGKTNVSQLLLGGPCTNPVYGQTNNPWRPERSPGASSGGEAAVIAVGGSALGLGSDIGGSVRLPADACGVYGFKPTSGRLTMRGHATPCPGQEAIACQPGPLARSVADLALALRLLTGATVDASTAPTAWPDPERVSLTQLRVGFYTHNGLVTASPAIRRAVLQAAAALQQQGVTVEEWRPPYMTELWRVYCGLTFADGLAWIRRAARHSDVTPMVKHLASLGLLPSNAFPAASFLSRLFGQRHLADSIRACRRLSVAEYWRLVDRRATLRDRLLAALDESRLDALLCPTFPVPAPPHRQGLFLNEGLSYTAVYNLLGLPAGTVPMTRVRAGEESDRRGVDVVERAAKAAEQGTVGMPVGVQVVARHWREDIAIRLMAALEGHCRQQPDYPTGPPL